MELNEEVHSDGSYELVNFDDYASETEHLNVEADRSSSMGLSDDGSYDLLCSEVSDTLVLTEDEALYNIVVSKMKAVSTESAKGDMEFKSETDSYHTERELGFGSASNSVLKKGDMGIEDANDSDHMEEEGDMGIKDANDSDHTEEGDMGFDIETNSDSKVQPIPHQVKKGKKRDLMTMFSESSDLCLFEFPAQIKLKDDIKEVAKNHITRYLPAKSLFKCRQVSKEWNKWISSPFFAHMQSHHFRKTSGFFQNSKLQPIRFISLENSAYGVPYPSLSFLPERVSIKSSCNGLLLCQVTFFGYELYICNPANKQWIKLPPSSCYHGLNSKMVLAFEPSSLNFEPHYQVICLFSVSYPDAGPIVHFDVYDSITKSWQESDMLCTELDAGDLKSDGIFVNGVAYWETVGGELLACDFNNGIYSVQKLPIAEGGALSNVHGELCYVRPEYDHSMKSCILDVYGGGVMSLKKTIYIPVDGVEDWEFVYCTVVGNSCDDVVALVVRAPHGRRRLYVYHLTDDRVQEPEVFSHSEKLFPYVNSLVSIDA